MRKSGIISLLIIFYLWGQAQNITPPANLKAVHILDEADVQLSWWEPGTPIWLHYHTGVFGQSVGFNEAAIFDAAIKYEPVQLIAFDGMTIEQFSFVPTDSATTYSVCLWMGDEADSLVYTQEITAPVINEWNTIDLDSVITIDAEKTWYFGLNIDATGGYPVGCDVGPAAAPGKCDLIRTNANLFESVYQYGLDLNFCIQVYLSPAKSQSKKLKALDSDYKNYAKILALSVKKNPKPATFDKQNKAGLADSYNIYRNNSFIVNTEVNSYTDTLEQGGNYNYYVTAVYGEDESAPSNTVELVYDNQRIYPNTIIAEALINTNEMSPSSPGAYLGMYEMNYEFERFAPIIYHSATEILGDDPFSNPDSEERFWEYFNISGAFPMAIFNGTALAGGGSGETLYEYYRGAYESVLDIKTPLTFDLHIEKISNTKYKANIESKVVGVYSDLNLKLHVVLTESNIDYTWNHGEINQVNFVARGMFPDYQGTPLNFVGDSIANASVEFEIDPFVNKDNYKVVAFIQHPTNYQILNGDIKAIPQNKNVTFSVTNANTEPIANATIIIDSLAKTSDENGQVVFGILDNMGEVSYEINHADYLSQTGVFNIDTTRQVFVVLNTTDLVLNKEPQLSVYPNPAHQYVYVRGAQGKNVQLLDVTGKLMREFSNYQAIERINFNDLYPGIYFIKCESKTIRFLIN